MMTLGNGRKREAERIGSNYLKRLISGFKVTNRYSIASPIDFEPASGVIEVVREDQSPQCCPGKSMAAYPFLKKL